MDDKLKHAVSQTIKYDDGSETVIHYNEVGEVVEPKEEVEKSDVEKVEEEISASEPEEVKETEEETPKEAEEAPAEADSA